MDSSSDQRVRKIVRLVRPVCPGCGQQIDPEVCWCGELINKHCQHDNHYPVPMGCECGRHKEEKKP